MLHRLDALPVPIKDIIKLVAKKLARVRKHDSRTVADAASALIAKWCAAYNSTAPPGLSESAQGHPGGRRPHAGEGEARAALEAGATKDGRPEAPLQREASVTFEDDELLRKAARNCLRCRASRRWGRRRPPCDARQDPAKSTTARRCWTSSEKVAKGVPIPRWSALQSFEEHAFSLERREERLLARARVWNFRRELKEVGIGLAEVLRLIVAVARGLSAARDYRGR